MNTNQRTLHFHQILFIAAFLLALLMRVLDLGAMPFNDKEASLALQALQLTQGEKPILTGQPLYTLATSVLFFLLGNTNFIARLLPALAGTTLILTVYLLRHQIGTITALIFSFALALDPGFVTQSRLVGGSMLAITTFAFCTYFWVKRRLVACGIAFGLFLLSGPAFLHGMVVLALAGSAYLLLERNLKEKNTLLEQITRIKAYPWWLKVGGVAAITLLLSGSLFFIVPQGLSAIAVTLTDYLSGWFHPSSTPAFWLFLALPIYHPIAILFAAAALVRALNNESFPNLPNLRQRFLILWFAIAFLLSIIYPARQMGDLLWALLPLWLLAAQGIEKLLFPLDSPNWIPLLQGCAVFILFAMFGLQVAAYSQIMSAIGFNLLRVATILSTLVLIGLVVWLVSLTCSSRSAWQGLFLGALLAIGIFSFAGTWSSAINYPWSQVFRQEFWKSYPQIADADLVQKTIHDLSSWKVGRSDRLAITLAVDSPALRWLLRDQQNIHLLPEEAALAGFGAQANAPMPDIIITRASAQTPSLAAAYRGQDFNWWVNPIWQSSLPADPLSWLLFRRAPWQPEQIILWVRSDVFPSGAELPPSQSAPVLEEQFEESQPAQ